MATISTNSTLENQDTLTHFEQGLFQLNRVFRTFQAHVERQLSLDSTETEILRFLQENGPRKMKDIGKYVDVKLSNLTNITDRLEEQKLVKRVNSKEDRRSVFVELTAKGTKMLSRYDQLVREISLKMKNQLSEESFAILAEGLTRISTVELSLDEPTAS